MGQCRSGGEWRPAKDRLRGFVCVTSVTRTRNLLLPGIRRNWLQGTCFGYIRCEMLAKYPSRGGSWVLVSCEDQAGGRDSGVPSDFPIWNLLSIHRSLLSSKIYSVLVFQNQSQDPLGLLSQSGNSDPESNSQSPSFFLGSEYTGQ